MLGKLDIHLGLSVFPRRKVSPGVASQWGIVQASGRAMWSKWNHFFSSSFSWFLWSKGILQPHLQVLRISQRHVVSILVFLWGKLKLKTTYSAILLSSRYSGDCSKPSPMKFNTITFINRLFFKSWTLPVLIKKYFLQKFCGQETTLSRYLFALIYWYTRVVAVSTTSHWFISFKLRNLFLVFVFSLEMRLLLLFH